MVDYYEDVERQSDVNQLCRKGSTNEIYRFGCIQIGSYMILSCSGATDGRPE